MIEVRRSNYIKGMWVAMYPRHHSFYGITPKEAIDAAVSIVGSQPILIFYGGKQS